MGHNEEEKASFFVLEGFLCEDATTSCQQSENDEEFYFYHAFLYTFDYYAPISHELAIVGV